MTKKGHKCDDCEYETFTFPDVDYKHEIGNKDCSVGWCTSYEFPRNCKCGGLIHANFGDESYDGDYWCYQQCDKCVDDYEEKE